MLLVDYPPIPARGKGVTARILRDRKKAGARTRRRFHLNHGRSAAGCSGWNACNGETSRSGCSAGFFRGILGFSSLPQAAPTSEVIVNLSLDGVGEKHDSVRGVKGNFERAMRTYAGLKALKGRYKNFTLGVHTVISNFNVDEFENIYNFVRNEMQPDSFISEIAEERVELDTVGMGITPPISKYQPVIERLQEGIRQAEYSGVSRITQAFRDRYYDIVKRTLVEKRQVIPCLAGVASAQIAPNGDVWTCCIRAESVGNLREHNYDFAATWRTAKANELRRSIKAGECYCPLANASYTNMLCHPPTLASVGLDVGKATAIAALSPSLRSKSTRLRNLPVINTADEL